MLVLELEVQQKEEGIKSSRRWRAQRCCQRLSVSHIVLSLFESCWVHSYHSWGVHWSTSSLFDSNTCFGWQWSASNTFLGPSSPPSLALLTHAVAWLLWTQKHQVSVGIDIASSLMDTLTKFSIFLPPGAEVFLALMLHTLLIDPDLKLYFRCWGTVVSEFCKQINQTHLFFILRTLNLFEIRAFLWCRKSGSVRSAWLTLMMHIWPGVELSSLILPQHMGNTKTDFEPSIYESKDGPKLRLQKILDAQRDL